MIRWWPQGTAGEFLRQRRPAVDEEIESRARAILERVRREGDAALLDLTRELDGVSLSGRDLAVGEDEIREAYRRVDREFREAVELARANIEAFCRQGLRRSWFSSGEDGLVVGEMFSPVDRAGIYVPGGTAPLPSSVLMTGIPARVAGVEELVMCTPPGGKGKVDPHILVAAREIGVSRVFRVGGAQAIAAMAYGTESIHPVDVIAGPGNAYVTAAKKMVVGRVGIDMLAGPSEIAILADASANPQWVAADLLSQAEHDPLASAVLVTPSEELGRRVEEALQTQLESLPRRHIARRCLEGGGAIVLVWDLLEGVAVINRMAPEHLELQVEDPWSLLGRIRHAGAVFVGPYTPEPVGDYTAGPSHVLPTGGTARYASPLSVDCFRKKTNLIACTREALSRLGPAAARLAEVEGLEAHARSVRVRGE